MTNDLYLVLGLAVLVLSIPSVVSSFAEGRAPRIAAIMILVGGGLVATAVSQKPGGYSVRDVPLAITRVVARFIK